MKKSFVVLLGVCIVLGFFSAQIVYSTYRKNLEESRYNAYFIQIGSYNNEEMVESVFDSYDGYDSKYLVIKEKDFYNVYVGITTDLVNANKIRSIYEKFNDDIKIKPVVIDNVEFISNLEQYDILISGVDSDENVMSISDVILSSYEEMVLGI